MINVIKNTNTSVKIHKYLNTFTCIAANLTCVKHVLKCYNFKTQKHRLKLRNILFRPYIFTISDTYISSRYLFSWVSSSRVILHTVEQKCYSFYKYDS